MDGEPLDLGPRKKYVSTVVQRLLKDARITEAPVSLQRVIEHLQTTRNLEVQRVDFSAHVSGLLVRQKEVDVEYAAIGFNENLPWFSRRFTIAHEIGHLLLGHACGSDPNDVHNEREADMFANELLVPRKLIKGDFTRTPDIKALSRLYRVSGPTLTIGLMGARLI